MPKKKHYWMDKHAKTHDERCTVENFLDWCNLHGMQLGRHFKPKGYTFAQFVPIPDNRYTLLNKFFKIDSMKLDKERRKLLEEARKA